LDKGSDILQKFNIGTGLGEITSELQDNEHITFFISIGPKAYAYSCNTGRKKICVKGIPQKVCTDDVVTIPNMTKMVKKFFNGETDSFHVIYPYKIWKNCKTGTIKSSPLCKTWKPVMDKRVVNKESGVTFPFGL
jgi:hypothetical protein